MLLKLCFDFMDDCQIVSHPEFIHTSEGSQKMGTYKYDGIIVGCCGFSGVRDCQSGKLDREGGQLLTWVGCDVVVIIEERWEECVG